MIELTLTADELLALYSGLKIARKNISVYQEGYQDIVDIFDRVEEIVENDEEVMELIDRRKGKL